MDIHCKKCGEPWDIDSLYEEADATGRMFNEVHQDFRTNGCSALSAFGAKCSEGRVADPLIAEITDLLGDDIDGAAALMEDLGL